MGRQGAPGKKRPSQPTTIILSCWHTVYLHPPPKVAEELYCSRCQVYRHVTMVRDNFRVKCENCPWRHNYGADEAAAKLAMGKHLIKRPGHNVILMLGTERQNRVGKEDNPLISMAALRQQRQKETMIRIRQLAAETPRSDDPQPPRTPPEPTPPPKEPDRYENGQKRRHRHNLMKIDFRRSLLGSSENPGGESAPPY